MQQSGSIPEAELSLACLQWNGQGVPQELPGVATYKC